MSENKICALIRQTWYETAKKNLPPEDRLRFYEVCFEYEFYDTLPADDLSTAVALLFDMVRSSIDEDKERARARTARNRANGAKGGRPPQSNTTQQTDNNPVGSSGLPIYNNNIQNRTEQNNLCLKTTENEDTHIFFGVCLEFFARGCRDAVAEGYLFWNYYAAKGWKVKDGSDIVDRLALARAWRCSDCSAFSMKRRAPYVEILRGTSATEPELLAQFVDLVVDAKEKRVVLSLQTEKVVKLIEEKYLPAVGKWIPRDEAGRAFALDYIVKAPEMNLQQ